MQMTVVTMGLALAISAGLCVNDSIVQQGAALHQFTVRRRLEALDVCLRNFLIHGNYQNERSF